MHLLHQTSTVHQRVFTPKDFDTTNFYTRKLFRNVEPQTFHTNPFLQQTTLTTKMHFAPKTLYTNELVHQRPSYTRSLFLHLVLCVFFTRRHLHLFQTVCTVYTKNFKTPVNFTGETFCNNGSTKFYTGRLS